MGKKRESVSSEIIEAAENKRSLVSRLPLTLQSAMSTYFEENASIGFGDLRAEITLEALQRTETKDSWTIQGKRLGRCDVMELIISMIAQGYSVPSILGVHGMPTGRTYIAWQTDYRPFAESIELAEKMKAEILAFQALEIADLPDPDGSQTLKHKLASDLRMRLSEIYNPKKFGKRQIIDVNRNDDVDPSAMWQRFISVLQTYKSMIYEKTGIRVIIPGQEQETLAVADAEVVDEALEEAGMEGTATPYTDYNDMIVTEE